MKKKGFPDGLLSEEVVRTLQISKNINKAEEDILDSLADNNKINQQKTLEIYKLTSTQITWRDWTKFLTPDWMFISGLLTIAAGVIGFENNFILVCTLLMWAGNGVLYFRSREEFYQKLDMIHEQMRIYLEVREFVSSRNYWRVKVGLRSTDRGHDRLVSEGTDTLNASQAEKKVC